MKNYRDFFKKAADALSGPDEKVCESPADSQVSSALAITDSESFLLSVLEGIGDGVIVLDRNYKIISANGGYIRQVGKSNEEIIGKYCYEVSHDTFTPCFRSGEDCAVKRTFETGGNYTSIHRHLRQGTSFFYAESRSFPIKDSSGAIISAVEIICDITEKVKLEEELRNRVRDLEEFYEMAVGRELKMAELKNRIKELENELKRVRTGHSR
jgi:PAS domain S-box-containing protein